MTRHATLGTNSVAFRAAQPLTPGSYWATFVARAGSSSSPAKVLRFKIVR